MQKISEFLMTPPPPQQIGTEKMIEEVQNEDSEVPPPPPQQPENGPMVVGVQVVRDEEGGGDDVGAGVPLQQPENILEGVGSQAAARDDCNTLGRSRLSINGEKTCPQTTQSLISSMIGVLGGPRDKVHDNGIDTDKILKKLKTGPPPYPLTMTGNRKTVVTRQ